MSNDIIQKNDKGNNIPIIIKRAQDSCCAFSPTYSNIYIYILKMGK